MCNFDVSTTFRVIFIETFVGMILCILIFFETNPNSVWTNNTAVFFLYFLFFILKSREYSYPVQIHHILFLVLL